MPVAPGGVGGGEGIKVLKLRGLGGEKENKEEGKIKTKNDRQKKK